MNFLGLLANAAHEGDGELMDLATLVDRFELEHIPIGGPVFDVAKLDWLNGRYLRERLDPAAFVERATPMGADRARSAEPNRRARAAARRTLERPRVRCSRSSSPDGCRCVPRICSPANSTNRASAARWRSRSGSSTRLQTWTSPASRRRSSGRASARKESSRRRPPVLRRDRRKPDVDSALRFDGTPGTRPRARASA